MIFKKALKCLTIFLIIFLIIGITVSVLNSRVPSHESGVADTVTSYPVVSDISDLKVEIGAADFEVRQAETFSVESNLKYLTVKEKNGVLAIEEEKECAKEYNGAVLTLYIPKEFKFSEAEIISGAGNLIIDTLSADKLCLQLGAGNVEIGELNAADEADIKDGAGQITINSGVLNDMQLDLGAGDLNLSVALLGDSEINCGVGEANITLIGKREDYRIELDKGLGDIDIDGVRINESSIYGKGQNDVKVSGGVGAVDISFG